MKIFQIDDVVFHSCDGGHYFFIYIKNKNDAQSIRLDVKPTEKWKLFIIQTFLV